MKLKGIMDAVTSKVGRQTLVLRKHSPAILFAVGVTGVVATVVLASRATLKLEDILDDHDESKMDAERALSQHGDRYTEEDYRRDILVLHTRTALDIARLYLPAIGVGIVSIAALTGSHVILSKRNVALTAAYAAVDQGFKEYRKRVVDALGIEKDSEFRHGTVTHEMIEETKDGKTEKKLVPSTDNPAGSMYARWFDDSSPSWSKQPEYNKVFLTAQQNYANDRLRARGHVFLNEVYDMLGLKRTKAGACVGWVLGKGDGYIDFGLTDPYLQGMRDFVNGWEPYVKLDFNVTGVILDEI